VSKTVFFEDAKVDDWLPSLTKHPTKEQLREWGEATGDYYLIHRNQDFARQAGLKDVIVHGRLGLAWLGQLLTGWMGDEGTLKILGARYLIILYPNQTVLARARITDKYSRGGEHLVELELRLENEAAEVVTRGRAIVSLPSRRRSSADPD